MLSDAEEMPTDTDKAGAIGDLCEPNATSAPITAHNNDQKLGEGMDEDSIAFKDVPNTAEEDAYNVACWKVIFNKRHARDTAAPEAALPLSTDSENPQAKPRASVAQRLRPLPIRDEKVVLRPLGGLRLDLWPSPTMAEALIAAAKVSLNDHRNLILQRRPELNFAVISTPLSHVADAFLKVQELSLSQRTYSVFASLAAHAHSCKAIVPGIEPGTTSHRLVEKLQATGLQILHARMMGKANITLVTFEDLRVPRFVRFLGAELRCYTPPLPPPTPGRQNVPQTGTPS
ncbi:hypothetical protein MRX96_016752 [Rhipicephalus microplus]